MTVDSEHAEITVTASTRRTSAGADWYPRRNIDTNEVCWFYGPRLVRGVEKASNWCSADDAYHVPHALIPNMRLSDDLAGGVPCPACDARWSMRASP